MRYNTKQRNGIISFFKTRADKSFTLDDLLSEIETQGIAKSTLYRIAAELTEEGILRKTRDGGGRKCSYQYISCGGCRHLHIKCRSCGKLIHLDEDISHRLEGEILYFSGFKLDTDALIYGNCPACITTN